jgi:hypothetical protein
MCPPRTSSSMTIPRGVQEERPCAALSASFLAGEATRGAPKQLLGNRGLTTRIMHGQFKLHDQPPS